MGCEILDWRRQQLELASGHLGFYDDDDDDDDDYVNGFELLNAVLSLLNTVMTS